MDFSCMLTVKTIHLSLNPTNLFIKSPKEALHIKLDEFCFHRL